MSKISKKDTEFRGTWTVVNGKVVADIVCEKIERLLSNHLVEIAQDSTGWDILYRDPDDGRYWELVYLDGHLQGGGPPTLRVMTDAQVKNKYGDISDAYKGFIDPHNS